MHSTLSRPFALFIRNSLGRSLWGKKKQELQLDPLPPGRTMPPWQKLGKAGEKWLKRGLDAAGPPRGLGLPKIYCVVLKPVIVMLKPASLPRTVAATPSERSITPASYHRALRSPYLGIAGKGARAGPNEPGALRTNRTADARGNARTRADIIECRRKAGGGGHRAEAICSTRKVYSVGIFISMALKRCLRRGSIPARFARTPLPVMNIWHGIWQPTRTRSLSSAQSATRVSRESK